MEQYSLLEQNGVCSELLRGIMNQMFTVWLFFLIYRYDTAKLKILFAGAWSEIVGGENFVIKGSR